MPGNRVTRQQIALFSLAQRHFDLSDEAMRELFMIADGVRSVRHLSQAGVDLAIYGLRKLGPLPTLLYQEKVFKKGQP